MLPVVLRFAWYVFMSSAVAYTSYSVVGSIVSADAEGSSRPVLVRDELTTGTHRLTGTIMLPSECDQLSLDTSEPIKHVYQLTFNTWHDPAVKCSAQLSPRIFHAIVFGPAAGVRFVASLDQRTLPIVVYPFEATHANP